MDEKIQKAILTLTENLVKLDARLEEIRSSVNVLKLYVATQMSPDDPLQGLKALQEWEKAAANLQDDQERQKVLDIVDSLRGWIGRGKPPLDS